MADRPGYCGLQGAQEAAASAEQPGLAPAHYSERPAVSPGGTAGTPARAPAFN